MDDEINENNYVHYYMLLRYLYDDIQKVFKKREETVLKYLKQENLFKYDKINIMDVGWGGSIQESMNLMTNKEVIGYYFGTIITDKEYVEGNSYGYMFDLSSPDEIQKKVWSNVMMWEFIFSSPEGTTLDFKEEKGKIVPILDKTVKTSTYIETFMNASLDMMDKYLEYYDYIKTLDSNSATRQYFDLIESKRYEDMYNFQNIYNEVLMGTYKVGYVKKYKYDYIKNNFDKFIQSINLSIWQNAYIIEEATDDKSQEELFNKALKYNYPKSIIIVRIYRKLKRFIKKSISFIRKV
jgi:hypothetical protein